MGSRTKLAGALAVASAITACDPPASVPPSPLSTVDDAAPLTRTASAPPTSTSTSAATSTRPPRGQHVRFTAKTEYQQLFVVDEDDFRYLRFGGVDEDDQSVISLTNPHAVPTDYIRLAFLGVLYTPVRERVLMVGLGGGTFTTLLRRHFPQMWIDVVEIDPVVVDVARKYFAVREDERFRIVIADGAAFVERTPHLYDLVMLDAYDGIDIPERLSTPAFFQAVKRKTAQHGVVVLNVASPPKTESRVERRFRATFENVDCSRTSDAGNLLLYGRSTNTLGTTQQRKQAARELAGELRPSFDMVSAAKDVSDRCQ